MIVISKKNMANESEYANKNEKFQINLLFKYPSTILILIK